VEHLGLPARDLAALEDQYARMLGATVVFRNNKVNGWRHVALRLDSVVAAKAELEQPGLQ